MPRIYPNVVTVAQMAVSRIVQPGDTVVDATAGNGNDTVFLARLVGRSGKVYSFDIQENALFNTARNLEQSGINGPVELIRSGHEKLREKVPPGVRAVMFNLGYLPGGDHSIITRPATTLTALEGALTLLAPGGLVSLVIYPGHPGGWEEAETVLAYAAKLPLSQWDVVKITHPNRADTAPWCLLIQRLE